MREGGDLRGCKNTIVDFNEKLVFAAWVPGFQIWGASPVFWWVLVSCCSNFVSPPPPPGVWFYSFPIFCAVYLVLLSLADFPLRWCWFGEARCRPDSATLWICGRQSAELSVSQTARVHRTDFQAIGFSVASSCRPGCGLVFSSIRFRPLLACSLSGG
jgi:hypothetical protein